MSEEDFKQFFASLKAAREFVDSKYEKWNAALKQADEQKTRAAERGTVKGQLASLFPDWESLDVSQTVSEKQTKMRKLEVRIEKLEALQELHQEKEELEEGYAEDLETTERQATAALSAAQGKLSVIQNDLKLIKRRLVLEEQLPDTANLAPDTPERLKEAESALTVIRFKLQEAKDTIAKLADLTGTECPTCGQPLDVEGLKQQRKKSEKIVATMTSALSSTSNEVKTLEKLNRRLEEAKKIQAQIGELPQDSLEANQERAGSLSEQLEHLRKVAEQAKENARISKRLGAIAEELASFPSNLNVDELQKYREYFRKLEKQVDKLNTLSSLKRKLEGLPEIEVVVEEEYDRIVSVHAHYEEAKRELAVQITRAKEKRQNLASLNTRLSELEGHLRDWDHVQRRKVLFEAMKQAYGPKGLKVYQLKKICNAICQTLPKYSSIMFQEPRIEFFVDNDPESTEIDFYVRRFLADKNVEYPVGKLSGGERKRLAVAFIFSLADLVAPRKKSNLIILDEVGDGLDGPGEYAFASQLLPQLKQESVIITSHRPGIEAAQFDQHWTVTKKDGKSTLKVN
jgi:DNA repair exonuclease SbcCD ATPase subunit